MSSHYDGCTSMLLALAAIIALTAFERTEIKDGKLPAPSPNKCIRLHASGKFEHASVRVNDVSAGELADTNAELDITGYLSTGASNTIEVRTTQGVIASVWAVASPLIYIATARLKKNELEVTITNTTENTAQVDIGEHQFTVSPGTSSTKQVHWTHGPHIKMHALSDGLDREFLDEIEAIEPR